MTQSDEVAKLARECSSMIKDRVSGIAIVWALKPHGVPFPHESVDAVIDSQLRSYTEQLLAAKDAQLTALAAEVERLRRELHTVTETLEEHPEGYDGECLCKLCMSYGDS